MVANHSFLTWDRLSLATRLKATLICSILAMIMMLLASRPVFAGGEPAEDFIKQLRAAGYHDIAIRYLDQLKEYPGVDESLIQAVPLEKANTYIDAAGSARTVPEIDELLVKADSALKEFLKNDSHPRASEARIQLGGLQMYRANFLLQGKVDEEKKTRARESFLAAAATYDTIIKDLRGKLEEMQGAKLDPNKPELKTLRDRYRIDYVDAKLKAGNSRRLAVKTLANPAKDGKATIDEAMALFKELEDKYSDNAAGAFALLHLGQMNEMIGKKKEAIDFYLKMLEQVDADALRSPKYEATSGLIRIWLAENPPDWKRSVERGQAMINDLRPDEKLTPQVFELKLELAKAYIAQSKDTKDQKKPEIAKADRSGRSLLTEIEKYPGMHAEETAKLLKELGVDASAASLAELPKAEKPESLADALTKARTLLEAISGMKEAVKLIGTPKDDVQKAELEKIEKQTKESRLIAIQILVYGVSMVGPDTDLEMLREAKYFLSYLLYEESRFRDAAVVGNSLTRSAPGTDYGLKGGLFALEAYRRLYLEAPETSTASLTDQLKDIADYLMKTWPDDPSAASGQGIMIKLALQKENWAEAKKLIEKMPAGAERAMFQRLMGQLLWNQSVIARHEGKDAEAAELLKNAEKELISGLEGIKSGLVEMEGMRAALVLAKVQLKMSEDAKALSTLDHKTYGPLALVEKLGSEEDTFKGDLFGTELQVLVSRMTADGADTDKLLTRATKSMEKLRDSYKGEDGQKRLTSIYMGMANDLKEELKSAAPAKKDKLIRAFRVFLSQIAETSKDPATLKWIFQTMVQLGEAAMTNPEAKADGLAKELLETAATTYEKIGSTDSESSISVRFQLGRTYRLLGRYSDSLNVFEGILKEKPTMLVAQVEAALAYEQWAAELPDHHAPKAYSTAMMGGRPGPDKKNVIWGWGRIAQLTNGKEQFKDMFFEARYHVAFTRFMSGKRSKNEKLMKQAIADINTTVNAYSDLGGPALKQKHDALIREIQKATNQPVTGL